MKFCLLGVSDGHVKHSVQSSTETYDIKNSVRRAFCVIGVLSGGSVLPIIARES